MKKILTIFVILILLVSCSKTASPEDMQFYVLNRNLLTSDITDSETVKLAKNSGRLVFDGNDIEGYNWQTHTVNLYESSVTSVGVVTAESGGSAIFKTSDKYAFVLIIGDDLVYTGGFTSGTSTPDVPLQPSISDNGQYSFKILFDAKYASYSDNRDNIKLYNFLNYCGKLSSKTD